MLNEIDQSPIVSIIIPNFNNCCLLNEMISCVKSQTLTDWELIVVDDGSTDDSIKLLNDASNSDSRISFYIRSKLPKGGQNCRNIGFNKSKGKYVVFFDSDDLISENCLQQRVAFMENNTDIDFGIFPAHSFIPGDNPRELKKYNVCYGNKEVKDTLYYFLKNQYPHTVWTNIYRRNSIKDLKWDVNVLVRQDFDFNVTALLLKKSYRFCLTGDYDYFYRGAFGENNVSQSFTNNGKAKSMIYLFEKVLNNIKQQFDGREYQKYSNALKRYVVNHYNTLIILNNKEYLKEYMMFCERHFNSLYCSRLKIVSFLACRISSGSIRTYISYILFFMIFGYSYYFRILYRRVYKLAVMRQSNRK